MAQTHKHTILVVDDEPDILFSLQALLRRDFEVHTAESGARALEVLRQHPVHVIMTDQRMPEMTGVELLRRVCNEYPEATRIIFTGYADIKAVVDAVNRVEIFRYLTKPWDPDDLHTVLHQACEHYESLVEGYRLLDDVRDYVARGLASPEGRNDGQRGEAGDALLIRLDQALAKRAKSS
jgi:DNA-binding NtrC family response regulator